VIRQALRLEMACRGVEKGYAFSVLISTLKSGSRVEKIEMRKWLSLGFFFF
jgi:hypothetical protein